jgi:hypothetical protein
VRGTTEKREGALGIIPMGFEHSIRSRDQVLVVTTKISDHGDPPHALPWAATAIDPSRAKLPEIEKRKPTPQPSIRFHSRKPSFGQELAKIASELESVAERMFEELARPLDRLGEIRVLENRPRVRLR